jgi:hypothetical protein
MASTSLLRQSIVTLNGLLLLLTLPMLVSITYHASFTQFLGPLALILFLFLKVVVHSAIYGVLIQLASGEEKFFSYRLMRENARALSSIYVVTHLIFVVSSLLIAQAVPAHIRPSLAALMAHWDIVFIYVFVSFVIHQRYLRPRNLPARRISVSVVEVSALLVLYIMEILVYYGSQQLPLGNYHLANVPTFFKFYIHFLECQFIARLIFRQYPEVLASYHPSADIILVNPIGAGVIFGLSSLVLLRLYPPFFVVLKALTPKHYRFKEYNRVMWRDEYYESGKLVALTCYTANAAEAYVIAKGFRERGSKVIIGGPHVSYMPEEALAFCDSVVIGEAEGVWKEVIADYQKGELKTTYHGHPLEAYYDAVHEELMQSPPYVAKDFIETTRGCKFQCHFCSVPGLANFKVRQKPIEQVVALIEKIRPYTRNFHFLDNNIYSNPVYARELFKALKPLKINWSTQCTIDIAKNTETLKLAKESGCGCLLIGYEATDIASGDQLRGKLGMVRKYQEYTKIIKRMGIQIKGHFIFGFEEDTFKGLWPFWKFCFLINPGISAFSLMTPIPGTKLYDDMLKEDRISNLNWQHYGLQSLVFKHKRLNNAVLSRLWPIICILFIYTTSQLIYLFILMIVLEIHYIVT